MERRAGRDTGLVGRSAELRSLDAALIATMSGVARALVLSGAVGTGKTALLEALHRKASAAGAAVLRGSCDPHSSEPAVERLFGMNPTSAVADAAPPSLRLFLRVSELTDARPLVLILDDAHWCDADSLAWLDFLVHRGGELPLLVALAGRFVHETGRAPPLVGLPVWWQRLELGALREEDVRELARRRWRTVPAPSFVSACADASGGNPLVLERLLDRARHEDVPPDTGGAGKVAELGAELFSDFVLSGLTAGTPQGRQVVEAAAVLERIEPELLAMLTGLVEPAVRTVVDSLRDERIVVDRRGLASDRLREAVLGGLPHTELTRLRQRAARLLNSDGHPATEVGAQLVSLPTLSEPWMRAILRDAARDAEAAGATEVAARYLRRVLADRSADVAAAVDLARVIANEDPTAAYELLEHGLARTDDFRMRAGIVAQLGELAPILARVPEAVAMLGRALDELDNELESPTADDLELRARVESAALELGWSHRRTVAAARVRTRAGPAPAGHTPGERRLFAMRSVISMLDGGSRSVAVEWAHRAFSDGEPPAGWAFAVAAYVLSLADEVEDALAALGEVIETRGSPWTRAAALETRAWVRSGAGEVAGAIADASAAELAVREPWPDRVRPALATALYQRGDIDDATKVLDRISRTGIADDVFGYPRYLMACSSLAAHRGDTAGALDMLTACRDFLAEVGVANPLFVPWWLDAASLLVAHGRPGAARAIAEDGAERAVAWGAATGHGLALLARGTVTEGTAGAALLVDAVEVLANTPARPYLVRAETRLGDRLLAMGDGHGARKHFRRAVDLSVLCGLGTMTALARRKLVSARGRMPQTDGGADQVLSSSQLRVATLAAQGATNREIADSLQLALRTVETHLTSAYRKLGVNGRAGLGPALRSRHSAEDGTIVGAPG